MVTIYTTGFSTHKFYVLPTQYMCFVWISEQTTIISLYNINWLVCITETECVYYAVRTGSCNIIQVNIAFWPLVHWLGRLVAGLSLQRPGHNARSVHVRFMVDNVALWQVYSEYFRFSLSIISFHQFSISFFFTFLLLEGRKGDAWEHFNKQCY